MRPGFLKKTVVYLYNAHSPGVTRRWNTTPQGQVTATRSPFSLGSVGVAGQLYVRLVVAAKASRASSTKRSTGGHAH